MSKRAKQYRQGDVLIVPVSEVPKGVKKVERENGRIVLAHGEATGHAHTIDSLEAEFYETIEGERYLELGSPVAVAHQEHATIDVPAGTYKVIRQREYSPSEIRNVRD